MASIQRAYIFALVARVPSGRVVTYGDLARGVGRPRGARAVGTILHWNPHPIRIPCHRVVRSDGLVGGYAHGARAKVALLKGEGIRIRSGKIVDFKSVRFRVSV